MCPKNSFMALICMLAMAACKKDTATAGVLSPAEFSKVLVEIYLAEARMNSSAIPRDSAALLFLPFEERLFQNLELSDSVVRKTYQYYVDNPEELEKIYDSVIDTLSLREKKMRTKPGDKSIEKSKRIQKPEN